MLLYYTIYKLSLVRGLYKERYLFLSSALKFRYKFAKDRGFFPILNTPVIPYNRIKQFSGNLFLTQVSKVATLALSNKFTFGWLRNNIPGNYLFIPSMLMFSKLTQTGSMLVNSLSTNFARTFNYVFTSKHLYSTLNYKFDKQSLLSDGSASLNKLKLNDLVFASSYKTLLLDNLTFLDASLSLKIKSINALDLQASINNTILQNRGALSKNFTKF